MRVGRGLRLKERVAGLIKLRSAPEEVALGAAIGVFIAILPLYGLHTAMVLAAAFLFKRANVIAMFIGTSISTVVTLPLITWLGYTIGRLLLGSAYPPLTWSVFRAIDHHKLLHLYFPLFIGSLLLAAVLAVACYGMTLWVVSMAKKRRVGVVTMFLFVLPCMVTSVPVLAADHEPVIMRYAISPVGRAEYRDAGLVKLNGITYNLVVFATSAPGFHDVEKIYSDPQSSLPLKVERFVTILFRKEHLVEDYDPVNNSLIIRKFIGSREVKVYRFTAAGPFQNAVILPFFLRRVSGLAVGWHSVVRIPQEFTVTLAAIEKIRVPAGTFTAYRFDSYPRRFQVWISADRESIPLKIRGLGKYSLVLKKR